MDPLRQSIRQPIDRRANRRSHVIATPTGVMAGPPQNCPSRHQHPATRSRLLGLLTRHGWALVKVLSLAPSGLLLHLVELTAPGLSSRERSDGRAVLKHVVKHMTARLHDTTHPPGSMLATVGGCLLSERVLADLSAWASHPEAYHGGQRHRVELFFAPTAPVSPSADPLRLVGQLVPMKDPQPKVVAVGLDPEAHAEVARALRAR